MNASFFYGAKWYSDEEGRIVFKFGSAVDIDRIKIFNADTEMYQVLTEIFGKQYTKNNVLFEYEAESKKNSAIEEIILNSEE